MRNIAFRKPRTARNTSPKASNSKTRCKTVAKSSPRTPLPKASNSKTQAVAVDAKSPKHHLGHKPKTAKTGALSRYPFAKSGTYNTAFESLEQQISSLEAVDAKSPKHHLDTSRKQPKPVAKKLFHVTFGLHKNNLYRPREIWPWTTASESLEQQNTSPKTSHSKTQAVALEVTSRKISHLDTSRKRPKPDPKKPVAKSGLKTPLLKASNNKTQAVALDAKSPKTPSRHEPKTAKTRAKKLFHVTFGIHTNNNLLGLAKSGLGNTAPESREQQNTSPKASNSKTQAARLRSRKVPNTSWIRAENGRNP